MTNQSFERGFSQDTSNTIGVNFYSTKWRREDRTYSFIIWHLNTSKEFIKSHHYLSKGASVGMIIYDATIEESYTNVEKWLIEVVLFCGNVPIILVGINAAHPDKVIDQEKIQRFVREKEEKWEVEIYHETISSNRDEKIPEIIKKMGEAIEKRHSKKITRTLKEGTISALSTLLMKEAELTKMSDVITTLGTTDKTSAEKLVRKVTIEKFMAKMVPRETLEGIPLLLESIGSVSQPFKNELITQFSLEDMSKKTIKEEKLAEIRKFFGEMVNNSPIFMEKILGLVSERILVEKITRARIYSTIDQKRSFSTVAQLVKVASDDATGPVVKIIEYAAGVKKKETETETLEEIGKLLAIITQVNQRMTVNIIENAAQKIIEEAYKETTTKEREKEKEPRKSSDEKEDEEKEAKEKKEEEEKKLAESLEYGEKEGKKAAREEVLAKLGEIGLLNSCLQEIKRVDLIEPLIQEMTVDVLLLKLADEEQLSKVLRCIGEIARGSHSLTIEILHKAKKMLLKKLQEEKKIPVIDQFLLLYYQTVKLPFVQELLKEITLNFIAKKIIEDYARARIDIGELYDLILITIWFMNHNPFQAHTVITNFLPDFSKEEKRLIYDLISEFKQARGKSYAVRQEKAEECTKKITQLFVQNKLNQIELLVGVIRNINRKVIFDLKKELLKELEATKQEFMHYDKETLRKFIIEMN
ncbi:MAG: hypothetical protein GF308_19105 [Candidatus Heimdallarchaeota archaeon]|nr:hypothetical protein [Candidatus Heimdallarchaeota archaeon]